MFVLKSVKVKEIIYIDNLEIQTGKVTCIVGPSGSGKSTILRLLNHLASPDFGEVLFKNTPLNEMNPIELRRQVVMAAQTPVIFSGTVEDNLQIGLKLAEKEPASEPDMKQVLQMVRLNKELSKEASDLSGGEKQRVALARILLMKPDVVLLDEPSSALDDETANLVISSVVETVKKAGNTLVMITHDMELANELADEIIDISPYSLTIQKRETY